MTRDEIISMAREAGLSIRGHYDEIGSTPSELERFAALVAAAERGACAKIAARAAPQPPKLSDERIREIWVEHGLDDEDVEGFARAIEREILGVNLERNF